MSELKDEVFKVFTGKKIWRFIKLTLIMLFIFLGLSVLFAYFASQSSSATLAGEDYLRDIAKGNCSAIYESTTKAFQKETDDKSWALTCQSLSPILNGDPEVVELIKLSDERREVVYSMIGATAVEYHITLGLVREGGDWLLDGFNSVAVRDAIEEFES